MNVNFFNFLVTRQLVVNKTGDTQRANQLGMLTSFVPGTWGMMMGMLLANREEAPPPTRDGGAGDGQVGKETSGARRELPSGHAPSATAR